MSRKVLHVAIVIAAVALVGCGAGRQPQLKVLSVEHAASGPRDMVLFVEVTNPAARPLELRRLQYRFERSVHVAGVEPIRGEVMLSRTVDAGAAVVVEVPVPFDESLPRGEELMLAGRLFATQDQLQRSFDVRATVVR